MPISAQSKLAARNGAAFISALKRWNETIDLLLDHRSVRAFSDKATCGGTSGSRVSYLIETLTTTFS
ncbi:hypothetical protein EMIT0194P_20450 [Pseudomonas serbica]